MLDGSPPTSATFAAGNSETELRIPTKGDSTVEDDSTVTVSIQASSTYRREANDAAKATTTILDDDAAAPPGGTSGSAGTTVWSADMSVTDYGNGSIGAGSASLLANQRGSEGLQAKWLYYHTGERKLRMSFTTNVDSGGLTVNAAGINLPFPEGTSGNSSFTWENVNVNWTGGQTFEAHLVRGERAATTAPDPTLKTLTVSNATLSPAFDPETTVYAAVVEASTESVTVAGTPNDDDAEVAFGPSEDADSNQADHQVVVPMGETLTTVTVTAADGETQRAYRVVVNRPPTVAVTFGSASYTATEGGDAASVIVELGTDPGRDVTIPLTASPAGGAAAEDYTVPESVTFTGGGALSQTIAVAAVSDNAEEDGESVVLRFGSLPNGVEAGATTSATVTLVDAGAHAVNTAPTGSPSITGTAQVDETLTASVSGIADADGTESATFTYQWVSNNGTSDSDINDATKSTYTVVAADVGKTIKVRVTFTDDGGTEESLVSAATDAVTARSEPVVDATPTISIAGGSGKEGENDAIEFSVTLDEAASGTVTVDYETSDGSAEAGADYSAASGTLSFSAGATRKTISVAISNDSVSENDETFTVTLSNASGGDLGTSEATGTIRNRAVTPVTASFSGMPNEHEGDGSEFTFDLGFNQNVKAGFRRIRDKAFTVSGGDIKKAQRKTQGSNQNWKITVEPDGNSEITITLPETTDCDDDGAICTEEGGMLNHSTSDTVLGPVGISIADAEVEEGANAVLVFAVALSRAASNQMTVDYATSDGTATAGADYTSASGTLTINAGSSSATIEVAVIDDEHNEGSEAFTLTLSNASSGDLTNASATGTITNHDALPKALIARFGRTAAVHIVDQVEERVNAPRAPGFDGRVAGRQINRDMGQQFALDFLQQLGGGYGQQQGQPRARMTATGANDPRFGNGGMTSSFGPQGAIGGAMDPSTSMQGLHPGQSYDQGMGMGLGSDRLLQGSSFALNRATSSGGILSFWSRSAQSQFYGQDGALALNGDVRTSMFGADYSKGRMVTGVSLSHSRGLGRYAGVDSGQVNSAVTGLYPWIGYKASERVTVWTVAGYGAGGLMLNPGAGAPIETGLSMAMAAGGGRGQILGGGEGFGLAFKADTLWVGMRTKAASGPGGNLDSTTAAVSRLRTALEGSQSMTIAKRMALTPSVEIGIRQDGGDAETGRGMDLGAGLVLADGVTGLAVDIRVRRLLVHQAEGFAESGMSISVSYNPTPSTPLGFTARVSPAWGGESMSGAEALWGRESMAGMGHEPLRGGGGQRLDSEVGYGMPIGSRFVGTPRAGVRTSEYGRDYRIGYGMQVLEQRKLNLQLGIDAERRESPLFQMKEQSGGTDQRVLGHATVQW